MMFFNNSKQSSCCIKFHSAGTYYFRVVIQNTYRYDVTVTTTLKDTRFREIVIPGKQNYTIDIKVGSLDPVQFRAKNPSGQTELVNNAYSQEISGTIAQGVPQRIYIGSKGKTFVLLERGIKFTSRKNPIQRIIS